MNEKRFWQKVNKNGPIHPLLKTHCWLWTASLRNKGYGAFCYSKNGDVIQGRSHRYSYELHLGEIPPGLCVLHKCDNPPCVNPDHLWVGTRTHNNADMVQKGRHCAGGTKCKKNGKWKRGQDHHATKLSPDQVKEIRHLYRKGEYGYIRLAKQFNVHQSSIIKIIKKETYKYV